GGGRRCLVRAAGRARGEVYLAKVYPERSEGSGGKNGHRSSRQILRFAQDKLWIYRCGRVGFDAGLDGAMCLLCETRRRCGRIESANPFSMVWLRSLLCSVLRCTPSFFEACVTLPRLAVIAATMYLPSNASTACSSVMPFPINSRMIAFRRS